MKISRKLATAINLEQLLHCYAAQIVHREVNDNGHTKRIQKLS